MDEAIIFYLDDLKENDLDFEGKCLHEASHAVIGEVLNMSVEEAHIYFTESPMVEMDKRQSNICLYLYGDNKNICDKLDRDYITLMISGASAVAKVCGSDTRTELIEGSGGSDYEFINKRLNREKISDYRLDKHIKRTDALVNNEYVWDAIIMAYDILQEYCCIDGSIIKEIVEEAIPPYELIKIRQKFMATPYYVKSISDYYNPDNAWYGNPDMDFIAQIHSDIADIKEEVGENYE